MQQILVAFILLACVAYTARRLWKRFTKKREDDAHCAGCPLADTCQHKPSSSPSATTPDCCQSSHHTCCHQK